MAAPSRTTSALVVALGVALGALFGLHSEPFHAASVSQALTPMQATGHAEVAAIGDKPAD